MTLNSRLNIIGKVGVDGGFGVLRQQSKTFRDRPANWFSRVDHGYGLRVLFSHNFCSGSLLPFAAPPSFESLLAAGSWEMISLYERIQQLAELLVFVLAMNTTTNSWAGCKRLQAAMSLLARVGDGKLSNSFARTVERDSLASTVLENC
jgi:hypothetical protein